jgi:hypothetical protein
MGLAWIVMVVPLAHAQQQTYVNESLLHEVLLQDYVKNVAPAPTTVALEMVIFKVQAVSVATGLLELRTWMRMKWNDPRLTWNPDDYGGLKKTRLGSDFWAENGQIWMPDITAYNVHEGVYQTFDHSMATVDSNGSVYLSRSGSLKLLCKYTGLVAFPFDQMSCMFEMGGWKWSGAQQDIVLDNGGVSLATQELSSGPGVYEEYRIENVSCRLVNYEYSGIEAEPWPIALYSITLSRATRYYVILIIFPSILITLLSFLVFWADTGSADALGYGINILVVVILIQLILVGVLPVCNEVLWMEIFGLLNGSFCFLALLQSGVCIMLECYDGDPDDFLVPAWLMTLYRLCAPAFSRRFRRLVGPAAGLIRTHPSEKEGGEEGGVPDEPSPTSPRPAEGEERWTALVRKKNVTESIAGILYRQMAPQGGLKRSSDPGDTSSCTSSSPRPPRLLDDTYDKGRPAQTSAAMSQKLPKVQSEEDIERLITFERLFLDLDHDASGLISAEECSAFLSYVALDLDVQQRPTVFHEYDVHANGQLTRMEFCLLCVSRLWAVPINRITLAMANLKDVRRLDDIRRREYWCAVSRDFDRISRLVVPFLYATSLVVVFNLDLTERASIDDSEGAKATIKDGGLGVWRILILPLLGLFTLIGWLFMRYVKLVQKHKELEKERRAAEATRSAGNMSAVFTRFVAPAPSEAADVADAALISPAAHREEAKSISSLESELFPGAPAAAPSAVAEKYKQ